MALKEHVKNVCQLGKGNSCCRYLVIGPKGLECVKNIIEMKEHLDDRVNAEKMVARGDNCDGRTFNELN
jgi:hypothetical protein